MDQFNDFPLLGPLRSARRTAFVVLAVLALDATYGRAQSPQALATRIDLAISSAPSPVGAGARAAGVGSAFIALADDATAASWNPGGLTQLERPEVSLVLQGRYGTDEGGPYVMSTAGVTTQTSLVESSAAVGDLNFTSAAIPFAWRGRNLVASLNYQQMLSFDRDLRLETSSVASTGTSTAGPVVFRQTGGLYALSPAVAVELTPGLSLGAAVNFWMDGIGASYAWKSERHKVTLVEIQGSPPFEVRTDETTRFENFHGTNATIGAFWRFLPLVTFGATVELPFQGSFVLDGDLVSGGVPGTVHQKARLEMPLAFGFGLAFHPSDRCVLAVDATRVDWGDFRLSDQLGNEFLISGDPIGAENVFAGPSDPVGGYQVDPVVTVRAGVEYLPELTDPVVALRAGAFYDPEPSRGAPEDFYGVSAGLGVTFETFSVDLAYQFRFGLDVSGTALLRNVIEAPDGELDQFQHSLSVSGVYYF